MFWFSGCKACGFLAPWPGWNIRRWNLNHWTAGRSQSLSLENVRHTDVVHIEFSLIHIQLHNKSSWLGSTHTLRIIHLSPCLSGKLDLDSYQRWKRIDAPLLWWPIHFAFLVWGLPWFTFSEDKDHLTENGVHRVPLQWPMWSREWGAQWISGSFKRCLLSLL